MAPLPWRPRIVYGTAPTTLNLSLPMRLHTPRHRTLGGSRVVDTGATATYVRRKDRLLYTPILATEAEYVSLVTFIDWAHANGMGPYTFRPDQLIATELTLYLESPGFTDEWEPERDDEDPSVFVFPILHRRTTDAIINLPAFP